jgi:riboflavin synthase
MFTGIVQTLGDVFSLEGGVLTMRAPSDWSLGDPLAIGESIAVNGCCLTVVTIDPHLTFDLSPETIERTALGDLSRGDRVNLERAMKPTDRFGGHIVQGHVDGTGMVRAIEEEGNATVIRFAVPPAFERYLIDKGSVAIDGVSLTVVRPVRSEFDVYVIPHTLEATNLGDRRPGDRVNLEFDLIAKYVERLMAQRL